MKKIISLLMITSFIFILSGCDLKKDNMDNISIYTTNYPTEYITSRLYGEHSSIKSIYPNGININDYKLTKKQITDYSDTDLYIFNGLNEKEKGYVSSMRDKNKKLKIIDDTLYMEYSSSIEELWLDPSNFLMMAQNIKNGFNEYIGNYYLNNDINKNYEKLKIDASNLDAKIKTTAEKAKSKTIITSDKMFKYLEKYGLTVYVIDSPESKDLENARDLINTGQIKYVFIKDNEEVNNTIKSLIKNTQIETQTWYTLSTISSENRNANEDYFSLMNENIDNLKNELYS